MKKIDQILAAVREVDGVRVLARQVQDLRHSSRLLVRALGFMQSRMEGTGCTPAQCHALTELAAHGRLTTGELAELLEVDKSTASRTLRPLMQEGLLEAQADPGDRPHEQREDPH